MIVVKYLPVYDIISNQRYFIQSARVAFVSVSRFAVRFVQSDNNYDTYYSGDIKPTVHWRAFESVSVAAT